LLVKGLTKKRTKTRIEKASGTKANTLAQNNGKRGGGKKGRLQKVQKSGAETGKKALKPISLKETHFRGNEPWKGGAGEKIMTRKTRRFASRESRASN